MKEQNCTDGQRTADAAGWMAHCLAAERELKDELIKIKRSARIGEALTRIQDLHFEKERIRSRAKKSNGEINDHIKNIERSLKELSSKAATVNPAE